MTQVVEFFITGDNGLFIRKSIPWHLLQFCVFSSFCFKSSIPLFRHIFPMFSPSQIRQNIWPGLDMIPRFLYFVKPLPWPLLTQYQLDSEEQNSVKIELNTVTVFEDDIFDDPMAKFMGPTWGPPGSSPCWPHEPYYQGMLSANVSYIVEPSVCQKLLFSVVPCLAPPHPDHGIWIWDTVNYGTILFQCMPGFVLEGYNSSTCYNGRWQRRNPTCIGRCYKCHEFVLKNCAQAGI